MEPRAATLVDASAIAKVQVSSSRAAYRGIMDDALLDALNVPARTQVWLDYIRAGEDALFVVDDDNRVVGYAHATGSPNGDYGEIMSIYVEPGSWRHGYGRKLLHAMESWLLLRHLTTARLWTLVLNTRARKFYDSCGYVETNSVKRHSKSGLLEICYEKALSGQHG